MTFFDAQKTQTSIQYTGVEAYPISPEEVKELHHIYGKEFETKYEEYEQMAKEGKIELSDFKIINFQNNETFPYILSTIPILFFPSFFP